MSKKFVIDDVDPLRHEVAHIRVRLHGVSGRQERSTQGGSAYHAGYAVAATPKCLIKRLMPQSKIEGTATINLRLHPDLAVMPLDNFFADR